MKSVRTFDEAITKLIAKIPARFENPFIWLGKFTIPLLWMVYVMLASTLLISPGRIEGTTLLVLLLLPLATVVKLFFRRKRPPTIYAESMKVKSYSFPSSHAYAASLAGGYVSLMLIASSYGVIAVACIALSLTIAISRVRIGAHYPSDVVAGYALGLVVLAVLTMVS